MRYFIYLLTAILFCFCNGQPNGKDIDYSTLHKQLITSNDYIKFKGYEISPRDENEDIYEYSINNLKLILFITYKNNKIELNDYSKKTLNDTLGSRYKSSIEEVKKEILNNAYEQISLIKKYNLRAVSSKRLPSDSTKWFIDFMLSDNGSLMYGNYFDSYYHSQNDVIKLDSEWIYIKNE